ncbi:MAG TPA: FAD-dependent oxidoreductase [Myxococcota bacterium]|jgi:3-oxo-5alpha-steroid 4-dehydrogenase
MRTGLRSLSEIARFEDSCDVLVVGLGCAGASAAIEARDAGADVIVLERSSGGGGTSAMSGGVIYLGGGTRLQRACGFEDSPEEMFKYLMASVGKFPDEEKIRPYCEDSVAHYDWICAQGVPFKETFYYGCSGEPPTDDGLVWSGSEKTHPYKELAKPAPRGHVPQHPHQTGHVLMKHLIASARASGARIQGDSRVTALVLDAEGEVVGAVAESYGKERALRARGGVVIATGGFVLNDEMLRRWVPDGMRCSMRVAADGDDGSGIRLGMAAGADVAHMDKASISLPVTQPWGLKRGVLVNAQGQRFINEDAYYGRLGEHALFHQDGRAWLIVDEEIFEKAEYPNTGKVAAVGETIAELETELGFAAGSLQGAIGVYNDFAARGEDPLFGKSAEWLKPLAKPPYGALHCGTENCLYAVFTLGGLVTDADGRVLDPGGHVVPGLYGAGRATAGISAGSYSSGMSLGDGTFFGRRAGRAAAGARG